MRTVFNEFPYLDGRVSSAYIFGILGSQAISLSCKADTEVQILKNIQPQTILKSPLYRISHDQRTILTI
jgi:hypothetical protein